MGVVRSVKCGGSLSLKGIRKVLARIAGDQHRNCAWVKRESHKKEKRETIGYGRGQSCWAEKRRGWKRGTYAKRPTTRSSAAMFPKHRT